MQLIISNEDIQELYKIKTRQGAYCRKRAILDALEKSDSKRLTIFDICKYESITKEQVMELLTTKVNKDNKIIKLE